MNKHGKKYLKAREKAPEKETMLPFKEALEKIKELSFAKFDETITIDANLSIDPKKGEQAVRGSVLLPHSIGKEFKVITFAKGDYAEKAKAAGADIVGAEDLIEKIEGGWLDFDYAVATPDLMGMVGKVAKILGPRGLLPNKKVGTVTFEVEGIIKELKKGRLFFKNDKNGIIHFVFGKVSAPTENLQENLKAFLSALKTARPASAKGTFIKKATISSTMGVGVQIDLGEIRV